MHPFSGRIIYDARKTHKTITSSFSVTEWHIIVIKQYTLTDVVFAELDKTKRRLKINILCILKASIKTRFWHISRNRDRIKKLVT